MMSMKLAGLVFGDAHHHLDHIAPLCHILNIPLITTDTSVTTAAETFYPDLICQTYTPLEMSSQAVLHFDAIISCLPRALFGQIFGVSEEVHQKHLVPIWCPHGNSDKGRSAPFMEALSNERLILVYGQKMLDFIAEKNRIMPDHIVVGNYRYKHYEKLRPFYDKKVEQALPESRTIFYAPTWDDAEKSNSMLEALPILTKATDHLFVKLHPNTYKHSPHLVEQLIGTYENAFFLGSFSPIYPLLSRAKAFIGDMSSIGYDYLTFNRPMFFFRNTEYLSRCGQSAPFDLSDPQEELRQRRQETYDYTFKETPFGAIKNAILERAAHHKEMLNI